jgi:hypothetical protein
MSKVNAATLFSYRCILMLADLSAPMISYCWNSVMGTSHCADLVINSISLADQAKSHPESPASFARLLFAIATSYQGYSATPQTPLLLLPAST